MRYFLTGATGFIGSRLAARLLARKDAILHVLVRPHRREAFDALLRRLGDGCDRVIGVAGDITLPGLGLPPDSVDRLRGQVDHFFHLAAVYDLRAADEVQQRANVDGTRHAVDVANEIGAGCFHLASSIAAAGLYEGVFREDMFEEAENLDHPYFRTKHDAERIVRAECRIPWRVYRPGLVVGDSRTGEMDKIDGPYYFFKPLQMLRRYVPAWLPAMGLEGGRINLVPVDYVAAAMDHIAHQPGRDGGCFHLVDPHPRRVGDLLNLFAHAGHGPDLTLRLNTRLVGFVPKGVRQAIAQFAPLRALGGQVMADLGLPSGVFKFIDYPTRFDDREARRALDGSGIEVPPLEDYAWRLWDYWERHLDPALFPEQRLRERVAGRVVVITGSGQGIGRAVALRVAAAGGTVLLVDRDEERLAAVGAAIEAAGGRAAAYRCDLTEFAQVDEVVGQMLAEHEAVDVLVNNAGRSIRRPIEQSYDRFHDFERLMRLNYFGALRVTLGLLPVMQRRRQGHVINISSIGVLASAPRFSAYVASKSAMDAFARCAASEFADDNIAFTTVNMPLVRTAMTAPTKIYDDHDMIGPDEASDLVVQAIIDRPERVATRLGVFAQLLHALLPKVAHVLMNTAYRMHPDATATIDRAKGPPPPTPEQVAFAKLTRGMHL